MNLDTIDKDHVIFKEVDRLAKQGDRIRIVNATYSYGKYVNGDEFAVKMSPTFEGSVRIKDVATSINGGNPGGLISQDEYVVLEPVDDGPSPKTERDLIASLAQTVAKLEDRVDTLGRELLESDKLVDSMLHVQSEQIDIVTDIREDVRGLRTSEQFNKAFSAVEEVVNNEDVEGDVEDVVTSPNHYNFGRFETIEIIEDIASAYTDGYVAYAVGNVIKYVARAPHKHDDGGLEDLRKAAQYLKFAIESITGVDDEEAD